MVTDFTMPRLGLTMEEGTVVRWLVAAGDQVAAGQAIVEVQTDKVTVEVEAPAAGMLGAILVREGETVPIGTLLARIASAGESSPEQASITPPARRVASKEGIYPTAVGPNRHRITASDGGPLAGAEAKRFSSPRARKHAREAGIDWRTITGSGPRGRVIERDILHAKGPGHRSAATASRETLSGAQPVVHWEEPTAVQRIAAERTIAKFTTTPHFYLTSEVSAEALVEMRERLLPIVERWAGVRLTITDLLVKVAAAALSEHPRANAFWNDGRIGVYERVDIGIATASEAGLLVPVLHRADQLSLAQLTSERTRLVAAARSGKLSPEDIAGGTFTLSNLGAHRVDQFQPVLNGAQSVILAAGRIAPRPFVINDQLAVARTIVLTIACDHRVLDGALAAAFFDRLIQLIEEPYELLV